MIYNKTSNLLEGLKILIIDDELDSLFITRALLEKHRATVIQTTSGAEGIELALYKQPGLILTDIAMPGTSGWDVLSELKEHPETRNIPNIALTALVMTGDRDRAIKAGFHNFLSKPLVPESFVYDMLNCVADLPQFAEMLKELENS